MASGATPRGPSGRRDEMADRKACAAASRRELLRMNASRDGPRLTTLIALSALAVLPVK